MLLPACGLVSSITLIGGQFLVEHLTRVPGIASIQSSFALKQVKYTTALPVVREAGAASPRAAARPGTADRRSRR